MSSRLAPGVWIFKGSGGTLRRTAFPSGAFSSREAAEQWIAQHRLTGALTWYPFDVGAYDWAVSRGTFKPRRDDQRSPEFIETFSDASQERYHYEHGLRVS